MRGEDSTVSSLTSSIFGSPPHARGRHAWQTYIHKAIWITPACAGKTDILSVCS